MLSLTNFLRPHHLPTCPPASRQLSNSRALPPEGSSVPRKRKRVVGADWPTALSPANSFPSPPILLTARWWQHQVRKQAVRKSVAGQHKHGLPRATGAIPANSLEKAQRTTLEVSVLSFPKIQNIPYIFAVRIPSCNLRISGDTRTRTRAHIESSSSTRASFLSAQRRDLFLAK